VFVVQGCEYKRVYFPSRRDERVHGRQVCVQKQDSGTPTHNVLSLNPVSRTSLLHAVRPSKQFVSDFARHRLGRARNLPALTHLQPHEHPVYVHFFRPTEKSKQSITTYAQIITSATLTRRLYLLCACLSTSR
jgi:hypothetical protein